MLCLGGITVRNHVFAALLPLLLPAATHAGEPYVIDGAISDCVNVRAEPKTAAEPRDCLKSSSQVTVDRSVPFWRHVTYEGKEGWVAKKFLKPSAAPAVSPSATAQATPLEIHFVDVGQGDAIWIHTPDDGIDGNGRFEGYDIVIDGGPYSADNSNPFLPYLEARGHHGAEVEALILTHPHTDHYMGAETVSRHLEINHYYDTGYPSERAGYNAFLGRMIGTGSSPGRAAHVHVGWNNFGSLNWGSELSAEFLHAWDPSLPNMGTGNTLINNASIVLRLQYGEHVFLFMGDAEGKERDDSPSTAHYVEDVLLRTQASKLPATLLKIAHHGSETSSTMPFLKAVNPAVVVVLSGRKSFRGTYLPDASTLKRLCKFNPAIKIVRTDAGDEKAGYSEGQAVDGDHIVVSSTGTGSLAVDGPDPVNCN